MPRRHFNDGQEVTYQDVNSIVYAMERSIYDRVIYEMLSRTTDAFFDDSFKVSFVGPTQVNVASGLGFQSDVSQVSPQANKRPLYLPSVESVNLTAPDGADDRIDIVSVRAAVVDEITASRKFKDSITSIVSNQNLVVQKDWEAEILVTAGTPSGSPAIPATPTGYIKIAELLVTAITGMSGAGAVTDKRSKMPISGDLFLNTLGYDRLTAAASVPLSTLMGEIDAFLYHGDMEYADLEDLGADPANPVAGKQRVYIKNGVMYFRDDLGSVTPVGSGGGGGGGAAWYPQPGNAPLEDTENGEKVFLFESGLAQVCTLWLKVPSSYLAGSPVTMKLGAYSEAAANAFLLKATATLVRKNVDAVDSVTNQHASTNTALTNTVSKQYRELNIDLSSGGGALNSVAISPGDLIRIELTRQVGGSDTDTTDVRFIPSATEIQFT